MPTASLQRPLSIGQLARAVGVPTSTLRYYERSGLLKPDDRSDGNYRQYHPHSVEKLRFIRSAQSIGLTLKEVSRLLKLADDDDSPCPDVERMLEDRIAAVREQIKQLRRVERQLVQALTSCCTGDHRGLCESVAKLRGPGKKIATCP